jgi:hypothetical protein
VCLRQSISSCSPLCWPGTPYVARADLEFTIFLL